MLIGCSGGCRTASQPSTAATASSTSSTIAMIMAALVGTRYSAAKGEGRLEVVRAVGPERDVRLGAQDPGHLVELIGDDLGHLIMAGDPDHRDQVDRTR